MDTLTIANQPSIIEPSNERSERAVLLEQLNQWKATERQAKRNISNIESRLAELNQCQTIAA